MGRIKALDPDVVHKIAAGEIIVSPANALKELIENSIDAGASNVDVVVKEGGHKLLQITDNGTGINEDDLPILCQRFTTSKISKFDDLESVETLGFRGEALASISHIAHLTVKTKTADSKTAIQAQFEAGKLVNTKRSAGIQGTQISVEDLFYNVPLRMRALQSAGSRNAEYQKILDVVSKYSIQYPGTFSCKRHQDNQPVVIGAASRKEKIRKVYGSSTYQELMDVNIDANKEFGLLNVEGYVTGLNYTTKRSIPFIFFINKRLISCEPLARAIRKVYQEYMPRGGAHAFVFLSIGIESQNVDVNIHPTKREVHFLHDAEIIEIICEKLKSLLTQTSGSRDFRVQSYISATSLPSGDKGESMLSSQMGLDQPQSSGSIEESPFVPAVAGGSKPRYEYNLVRTDPRQQRITAFASRSNMTPPIHPADSQLNDSSDHDVELGEDSIDNGSQVMNHNPESSMGNEPDQQIGDESTRHPSSTMPTSNGGGESGSASGIPAAGTVQRTFQDAQLESVQDLIRGIKLHASAKLLELFSEHTFIGVIDPSRGLAAIQLDVRLYLIEYHDVTRELFYQIGLTQFANFGTVHLGDGLPITKLMEMAQAKNMSGNSAKVSDSLNQMLDMAPMLEEYFQIILRKKGEEWRLIQLPLMLPGYTPSISRLPQFISDLATQVNWEYERECLDGIIQALAALHVPTIQTSKDEIETVFNAAKTNFVPSRSLTSCVVEIASLPGLYKVFERC